MQISTSAYQSAEMECSPLKNNVRMLIWSTEMDVIVLAKFSNIIAAMFQQLLIFLNAF